MSASKGQLCEVQITSGRWSIAAICKIISGDTVNLVAFTDAVDPWPDVNTPNGLVAGSLTSVAKGTSVGQWREIDLPTATSAAIAAAVSSAIAGLDYASDSDVSSAVSAAMSTVASNLAGAVSTLNGSISTLSSTVSSLSSTVSGLSGSAIDEEEMEDAIAAAVAAIPPVDLDGLEAVAAAGTSHSGLGFNAARRPSTTRPTKVNVTGTITMTSTLLGAQTAKIELMSDSSSSPTTVRGDQPAGLSGVAASTTVPWSMTYEVPAGDYYKLVTTLSANASASITYINETAA